MKKQELKEVIREVIESEYPELKKDKPYKSGDEFRVYDSVLPSTYMLCCVNIKYFMVCLDNGVINENQLVFSSDGKISEVNIDHLLEDKNWKYIGRRATII